MKRILKIIPNVMIVVLGITSLNSCASSKLSPIRFDEMDWHACRPSYDGGLKVADPVGKFCFHWCRKYGFWNRNKCKDGYWKLDILDMKVEADWKKIQSADMKLKK